MKGEVDRSVIAAVPMGRKPDVSSPMKLKESSAVARLLGSPVAPKPEPKRESDAAAVAVDVAEVHVDISAYPDPSTQPQQSTKELRVDVAELQAKWLGRLIPFELGGRVGKKAKLAAAMACCGTASRGVTPAFSTLAGMTQWRNAVVLWVNVGGDTYNNVFARSVDGLVAVPALTERDPIVPAHGKTAHKPVYMTWYASRKQHEQTPVIQLMIATGAADEKKATKPDNQTSMLLFCRLPDQPYCYCGRLRYCSHGMAAQVTDEARGEELLLRFVWELMDAHGLIDSSSTFRDMLAYGR